MTNYQGGYFVGITGPGWRGPLGPAIALLVIGLAVAFTNNAPVWIYIAIIVATVTVSLLLLKISDSSKK